MSHLKSAVVFVACAVLIQTTFAEKPKCASCGCEGHVKKTKRLVVVWEEVDIPTYQCKPMDVFIPDKGMVCRQKFICDKVCTLHKVHNCCECKVECCCETKCRCKTLYGAKSSGCKCSCCVRQPTGACKKVVPVLKWVTVHICKNGCATKSVK